MIELPSAPLFRMPSGVNFSSGLDPIADGLRALQRTLSYLQSLDPHAQLMRIEDLWQEDGIHSFRKHVDFPAVFSLIESPRSVLDNMRPDERMCVGVSSLNMDWYLRFWAGWDEEEWSLVTYFDVTVPEELVVRIERDLLPLLPITLAQEDAASHYEMIKHAIFM